MYTYRPIKAGVIVPPVALLQFRLSLIFANPKVHHVRLHGWDNIDQWSARLTLCLPNFKPLGEQIPGHKQAPVQRLIREYADHCAHFFHEQYNWNRTYLNCVHLNYSGHVCFQFDRHVSHARGEDGPAWLDRHRPFVFAWRPALRRPRLRKHEDYRQTDPDASGAAQDRFEVPPVFDLCGAEGALDR